MNSVTLTGREATVTWAWHTAAVCKSWQVTKTGQGWALVASLAKVDAFKLRQRPLLFNAPRKGGHWCWPVTAVTLTGPHTLTAALGPLEA